MNGKENDDEVTLDDELPEDDSSDEATAETVILSDDDDDLAIGDTTVEMKIEKLVAKLDASDIEDVHHRAEIRHKLEELREIRAQELDSTFNFNLDDEL